MVKMLDRKPRSWSLVRLPLTRGHILFFALARSLALLVYSSTRRKCTSATAGVRHVATSDWFLNYNQTSFVDLDVVSDCIGNDSSLSSFTGYRSSVTSFVSIHSSLTSSLIVGDVISWSSLISDIIRQMSLVGDVIC